MRFMQPNAVTTGIGASDKVPSFPFTPIARDSLDYVYTIITGIQVDVYRDGLLFASNILFSSSNNTSFDYTHYFEVNVANPAVSPVYNNISGVNFTFNRPITTINVSYTNPVDIAAPHTYALKVVISAGSNSYVQYCNATGVRINGASHLQYFANHFTVNATNTDYSKYVNVISGSGVVGASFSGYQDEAVTRHAPPLLSPRAWSDSAVRKVTASDSKATPTQRANKESND